MLNTDLVKNLFASLDKAHQQELLERLFKKSKQNMNYFERTKDISLSKLETLADYFHLPLDYFRMGGSIKGNNVNGDNNYVGNISFGSNLLVENQKLNETIELLNERIKDKEEFIESLKQNNEYLKEENNRLKQQESQS